MGKRVRWILFGVVLIGVVGAGLVRQTRPLEPAARFTMADGAEVSRVHGSDVEAQTVEFIVAPPKLPEPPR